MKFPRLPTLTTKCLVIRRKLIVYWTKSCSFNFFEGEGELVDKCMTYIKFNNIVLQKLFISLVLTNVNI